MVILLILGENVFEKEVHEIVVRPFDQCFALILVLANEGDGKFQTGAISRYLDHFRAYTSRLPFPAVAAVYSECLVRLLHNCFQQVCMVL